MGDRLSSGCTAGARASLQRDGLFTMGHGIHTRVKTVTIRFSLAWLVSLALRSGLRGAEEIVGGGTFAPKFIKLSNNIIMKKRTENTKHIPLLLPSNTLDGYGQRMLFQPWRNTRELVTESTDEDKARQQQNLLALFPRSTFV